MKCYKITEKTGNVVGAKAVNKDNEVMLITTEGIIIRIPCSGISVVGRIASGVKLMDVDSENVSIAGIAKVREEGPKEDSEDSGEESEESQEKDQKSEESTEG